MVGMITETPQIASEESATTKRPNHSVRSSRFKYYIHDTVDACRFQLIGELTDADIDELQGCWRTAKTTLRDRKLVLDLRSLNRLDDAGTSWLASMAAEGAEYVPGTAPENMAKPRPFRKLAAIFRSLRASSSDASTRAQ
jgi:ABC-type transporter Mla MlaB component